MKIIPIILILVIISLVMATGCTQSAPPPVAGTTTVSTIISTPAPTIAATAAGYTDLTPAQAKDLIAAEKNLVIVDVSPYFANGHLPGAISIPLSTLDSKIPSLDKTKVYLVYCHGDEPSIAGAQKLVDAGFPHVYRLAGNYAAWVNAGYPVSAT